MDRIYQKNVKIFDTRRQSASVNQQHVRVLLLDGDTMETRQKAREVSFRYLVWSHFDGFHHFQGGMKTAFRRYRQECFDLVEQEPVEWYEFRRIAAEVAYEWDVRMRSSEY